MTKLRRTAKRPVIGAVAAGALLTAFLLKDIISPRTDSGYKDMEGIFAKGVMTAAIEESPLSCAIRGSDTTGLYYGILKRFAKHHGLQLKLKVVNNLDKAQAELQLGGCNIIATGIASTMDARRTMHLSEPLHTSHAVLVYNKARGLALTSPYDLGGMEVTLPDGSPYATRINNLGLEIMDTIKVRTVSDENAYQILRDVDNDPTITTVCDDKLAAMAADSCKNIAWFTIGFEQNVSFGTDNGAAALNDSLDSWLRRFKESKDYAELCRRYINIGTRE